MTRLILITEVSEVTLIKDDVVGDIVQGIRKLGPVTMNWEDSLFACFFLYTYTHTHFLVFVKSVLIL